MIQDYLDESGIHDSAPICLIAGYFGGPGQWKKFDKSWKKILADYGISEFHAHNFWQRDSSGNRTGLYRGWDDAESDQFLDKLVSVIENHSRKIHPVTCAMVVAAFDRLDHNQKRFLTGAKIVNGKFKSTGCPSKPYFVPFQICVTDIADHAPVGGKADYAFDLNKQFKGYGQDLFGIMKTFELKVGDRIGKIDFPAGIDALPLQAADLLCYRSYLYAQERAKQPSAEPDSLLKRLIRGTLDSMYHSFLDDAGLATLLGDIKLPT